MKVAMIQMQVKAGDVQANRQRGLALAREAASLADVLVLPEIWTTGYHLKELDRWAEEEDGPTVNELKEIARAHEVWIVAGSLPVRRVEGVTNTMFVLAPNGTIAAQYDKIHMFSLYGEGRFFQPGAKQTVFPLAGTQAGLAICYDIRFPELFRSLTLAGAEVVFVAAEWPAVRSAHWRLLSQARALENQVFIIAVNCVGEHKGIVFYGHSLLVSPEGEILAEGTDKEEIVLGEVDLAAVGKARQSLTVWQDRRPDLYT
jgi:predicted amidohydrolase